MANRWGNNGNSERLYFQTFQSLSHVRLLATPWTIARQVPCPSPTPRAYLNSYPLSQWCHPTKSSAVIPFSSCLQFPQHQGLFWWVSSLHQVAKVLELQLQHQSFQCTQDWSPLGGTGWISLQAKGLSRVFSTPQFKSINSSVLSFLYSPTLTSIHDNWKNHSFD